MAEPDLHKSADFAAVTREYHDLSKKMEKAREWQTLTQELKHLADLMNSDDEEMAQMARSELDEVRAF